MRNKILFFGVTFVVLIASFVLFISIKLNQKPGLPEDMRYVVQEGQIIDTKIAKDLYIAYQTYKNVIINKEDKKGETLIYERYDSNWFSGSGIKQLSKTSLPIVIGRIVDIKPASKSGDLYITIEDPLKKEVLLTGRIVKGSSQMTDIRVEDVRLLTKEEPYIQIVRDSQGKIVPINTIVKKGDIVILQLTPGDSKDFAVTKKDANGYPYVTRIIIRRFGGNNNL